MQWDLNAQVWDGLMRRCLTPYLGKCQARSLATQCRKDVFEASLHEVIPVCSSPFALRPPHLQAHTSRQDLAGPKRIWFDSVLHVKLGSDNAGDVLCVHILEGDWCNPAAYIFSRSVREELIFNWSCCSDLTLLICSWIGKFQNHCRTLGRSRGNQTLVLQLGPVSRGAIIHFKAQ